MHKSFISIPILTPNIERGTVTSWHGIHSSALLLNLPLQLLWHPHPPQVKYLMVEIAFALFLDSSYFVFQLLQGDMLWWVNYRILQGSTLSWKSYTTEKAVYKAFKLESKKEEAVQDTWGKFCLAPAFFYCLLILIEQLLTI